MIETSSGGTYKPPVVPGGHVLWFAGYEKSPIWGKLGMKGSKPPKGPACRSRAPKMLGRLLNKREKKGRL